MAGEEKGLGFNDTSRKASFVESAPDLIVQEVLDCLRSVLDD